MCIDAEFLVNFGEFFVKHFQPGKKRGFAMVAMKMTRFALLGVVAWAWPSSKKEEFSIHSGHGQFSLYIGAWA